MQRLSPLPTTPSLPPVRPGFVALYVAAQVGAYIGFVPLLTLLLPLKVASIDPAGRSELLGQVALWGALVAGGAGVLAGVIGDHTRHWAGGRAVWMVLGLTGLVASYGLFHAADSFTSLLTAIVAFQISLNFILNPLATVLPETVPGQQKGRVAGFLGLAFPLASVFGAIAIGVWLTGETARLATIVVVTTVMVLPFVVVAFRGARHSRPVRRGRLSLSVFLDRDFLIPFGSRLLVHTAIALNGLYLLFYLDQSSNVTEALGGMRIEVIVGGLLATSTAIAVVAGLFAGWLSDRLGKRRILVFTGATVLSAGAMIMALAPMWPGPLIAQSLFGLGIGLYSISDAVVMAEVLPNPADTGRDLGLLNVAATAAQMLAPALGLLAFASIGNDLQPLYLMGAGLALLGGGSIMGVRRVG